MLFSFLIHGTGEKLYGQTTSTQNTSIPANSTLSRNKKVADSLFSLGSKSQDAQAYRESLVSLESSLKLYQLIGDDKKEGECFAYMAISYYYLGDYQKAIALLDKEGKVFRKIGYKKGIASTLNNIGGVYNIQGKYLKALNSHKQAAIIYEGIGDKKGLATATYNMGLIYFKAKDNTNAMNYLKQSYAFYEKSDDQKAVSQILNSMGDIYKEEGKYTKAFEHLNQSLQIADSVNDKQLKMQALSGLGELFYEQSDYKRALPYFNRCLAYSNELSNLEYQSKTQIAIGNILNQFGKNNDAVEKCRDGLKMAEELGSVLLKKRGCDCLYQSYKSLGRPQQALRYYEQANAFEDSLNLAETSNKIMSMEFQKQQLVDSIAYVKKEHTIQLRHKEEVQRREKNRNIIESIRI